MKLSSFFVEQNPSLMAAFSDPEVISFSRLYGFPLK
jgi:hypothetical protein